MRSFVTGIVLATLALYAWGMIYWGANPLPYTSWKRVVDDRAAQSVLREQFPETGTYYLPGMYNDAATISELHRAGPVAFVHITAHDGRPPNEPGVLVKGFLLDLAVVILIALLMRQALPALPSYGARLRLAALAGLAGVVLIDLGDAVWWYLPLEWKLHQALYDLSAWVVAGAVLAHFVRPTAWAGSQSG